MARRTIRSKGFSKEHRLEILAQLETSRSYLCAQHAHVRPFCDDYNAISKVREAIDQLALEWTGNAYWYHAEPHGRGAS